MFDLDSVRGRLAELLAEYRIPSAALGVLHEGRVTELAVGIKDVTTREPATTDTIYQCGSMTKTWTTLAVMQLVDAGVVDLGAPVRTHLPEFTVADPNVAAAVTPRQLLNHTNGIEEAFGDPGADEDVYARMVAAIADAPQVFPLGHTHGYSAALGYAILGRILEVADGEPWHEIMRTRLFGPLGQADTSCRPEDVETARAATGHVLRSLDEGPIVTPVDHLPRAFGPGGAVNSTVRDVLALAQIFLDGGRGPDGTRIVSEAAVREMMNSRVPLPDPYMFGPEWALGLIVCDWHGETVYATDGSTIGQNARLRILPDRNLAVTLLTNGSPREPFYKKVFEIILSDLGAPNVPEPPRPDPALRLDPARYVGTYARPDTHFEVTAADGNLSLTLFLNPMHAQFLGKPNRIVHRLLPLSETHFLLESDDPRDDPQTVALYDFQNGRARYLHTNSRVHPRA
ncbi:serine hydrolase domain-containing protein [Nocardia crassostreae]|uniref:serine hydrolase domain-containing protein n=1 Tax=Nocardia crassostreae TaxID=53428 RepID=UPI0008303B98|nr:serine hydrolase domain-containing protein [Nocardia crassostreae]